MRQETCRSIELISGVRSDVLQNVAIVRATTVSEDLPGQTHHRPHLGQRETQSPNLNRFLIVF